MPCCDVLHCRGMGWHHDGAVCAGQVLDAEARRQLPHTLRWYQTVASQPRFSGVAGPVKLADKVPCNHRSVHH